MPVVKRNDSDIGREHVLVQIAGHRVDAFEDDLRLLADSHQDHAFDGIVLMHVPELAEADGVSDLNLGDVLDIHRDSVVCSDDNIPDIFDVLDQAEATNVIELPTLRIEPASGIGVVVAELVDDLLDGDTVGKEALGIEQHLVLHSSAAEAGIVGNALNRPVAPLEYPIFDSLQLLRAAVGALEDVAVDETAWRVQRRERWTDALRHFRVGDALEGLFSGEVGIGAVLKVHLHRGQAIERDGAQCIEAGDAVHLDLDWYRDQALDFLGRVTRPLGNDFDVRRREVRIGIDGKLPESDPAPHHEHEGRNNDQEPLGKGEANNS